MRVSTKPELLARLAQGPLPLAEWPRWSASKGALKARISILRDAGLPIESVTLPGKPGRRPPVAYRLGGCPTCKRDIS